MKAVVLLAMGATLVFLKRSADTSTFPVPPLSHKSLFYIHRSTNPNTVVYEVNVKEGGTIDPKDPVSVFWIRYGERGQQKSLNYLERTFAYGIKATPIDAYRYQVEFVASKAKKLEVFLDKDGQAIATMNVGGVPSRLIKIFVQVAEDGWWPRVAYVEFFGKELTTDKNTYEKMKVNH
jgi:hypothetical protein